jgi:hypothetical protein
MQLSDIIVKEDVKTPASIIAGCLSILNPREIVLQNNILFVYVSIIGLLKWLLFWKYRRDVKTIANYLAVHKIQVCINKNHPARNAE